ncbi:sorbitol dehydrogenase-like [Dermatophagoides pteronyssinus]|uniref:sorbitol dehydrogenase-like n=1 Tax=Dermatophagoides pteronyssinus TaxID=6956 RepID=UPI003F664833
MPSKPNQAFVLHRANQAKLEPYEMPGDPGPNEVLCRTLAVGICGSDIHYFNEGRCGNFIVKEPMVLGHETVAEIVRCGENVSHLKPGDRVAIEPTIPCGECNFCLNDDQYNLCPNITCHSTPPVHGTLQHYFIHSAKYCFKVPSKLSNDECAMMEPLAVAVHACRRVNITKKSNILITGAGPIGLLVLQVVKAFGAQRVVITDINEKRLELAKELGADETVLIKRTNTEQENIQIISNCFNKIGSDIAFECSGVGVNFRLIIFASKPGGTCMFVGMGPEELQLPIASAAFRELKIFGSLRYKGSFPIAIDLVANGQVNLKKMVTHHFDFDETMKAFETAISGNGMKIIINVDRH